MNLNRENTLNSAIAILDDLVAFKVLGGESNLSIANYIRDIMEENGIAYQRVSDVSGSKMCLHCRIGPKVDGGTILSGHMDVVSTKGQKWTKPDFRLTREEDRLYGRGTADMKGFLACCLALLPQFKDPKLKRPIYLAFSYDEEIGCRATEQLLWSIECTYDERPAYAIIGEPSMMVVANAEKGAGFFKTEVFSAPAHSSEVRNSVSAIEEASHLIQWLYHKMDGFIQHGPLDSRFTPPFTTIHVGKIKGGEAVNIVADHCQFEWDIRNIPAQSIPDILREFKDQCQERIAERKKLCPEFTIRTDPQFPIVPGFETSEELDIVQKVNSLTGTKQLKALSFASEAGHFARAGFQTLVCGPGNMEQGHRADEFICISELEKCIHFLERLVDWSKKDKIEKE